MSTATTTRRRHASRLNRRTMLRGAAGAAALAVPATQLGGFRPALAAPAIQGEGVVLTDQLGRDYLAYPETTGTVEFSNCWGGARIPLIDQWIADFQATYPNIQVQSNVSDCAAIREQQVASLAGGQPANVMMIKSDSIAFFAEQNAILGIDDLMARDGVSSEWFYPGEMASRVWEGTAYGLPNVTAGALHLLFVNQGLLERIGLDPDQEFSTWQDLDALVEPAKAAGLFVMDPAKISTGMTAHLVFTYANGGRYWNDDLTTVLWNEPAGVVAAEWMLQFVKAQADSYENLATGANRNNVLQPEDWAPEQYVAMINGSWSFFQLASVAPHIDFSAFTFPRNADNPESAGQTPTTGGWSFCMTRAGADQAAAWEWLKFTCASSAACTFAIEQDRPSPVEACNEDPALAEANPYWQVVIDDLSTGIAVPSTSIHPQFVQLWLDMEDAILYEEMAPKEALDSYAEEGQRLLDEWNESRG
ncbi:MAG: extracellular solute-binding protein [Chloroflexota bacterium]|nr:extracellular solute-binding protein [Chloroflexota bacterium]